MIPTTLVRLLGELGHEVRSYSGRGMRGKECIGIIRTDPDMFRFGAELATSAAEIDINVAFNVSQLKVKVDNMGKHDVIVYFPDVEWPT